ncbi:MAG: sulfatase [Planctomycetota bacterium]
MTARPGDPMSDQPNILILMTDQQRADCLGCAGHPQLRTPNMDRLAEEGVHFANACTSSPVCMPARYSFITGQHVHNHGIWSNGGELSADYESMFRRLQRAGYYTGHIGKSHYYPHGNMHMKDREPWMHQRGFDHVDEIGGPLATCNNTRSHMTDEWERQGLYEEYKADYRKRFEHGRHNAVWPSPLPVEQHADSYVGRKATEFIAGYDRGQPLCLFVGFGGPHEPWDAPGEYAEMYDPEQTPAPIRPEGAKPADWVPEPAADWQLSGVRDDLTEADIRALRANYYGKISLIDHWFGRIFDACERRGMMDDLLILFWSDHGEMLGDHGRLYKSRFYESALRVPLIVRWPGRARQAEVCEELAATVDIMPTLLEAAGTQAPVDADGRSLMSQLRNPAQPLRETVLSEVGQGDHRGVMVRGRRYKYAEWLDGTPTLLYDLQSDPIEVNNLLGHPQHREVEDGLRTQMRDKI